VDSRRVVFVAGGNLSNAGSRFRAYWPAAHMANAEVTNWVVVRDDGLPEGADVVIFQKLVDVEAMRQARAHGTAIFWDVCDPSWWWNAADVRTVLELVTAVVASNEALADDLRAWADDGTPVHVIPDRLELAHYTRQRQHRYDRPARLIWFGASQNRAALYAAHTTLSRLQANDYAVALTICDNAPNTPMSELEGDYPIYYTRWALDTEVATLTGHDIALLPPYPGPWGRVKSNNKALTAAACGLPVTTGCDYAELRELVADVSWRQGAGALARREVEQHWRVEQSAAEWQTLIGQYVGEMAYA
jgi:hypothetical protein